MQQYLELLKTIKEKGTYKPAARENMPGTQSLFGYQFRHNLAEGFPLLTTKKMYWKGVVVELLWFLRGDTNIKYLVDNGVKIWNEDAYQYYCKKAKAGGLATLSFDNFMLCVKGEFDVSGIDEEGSYNWNVPGYNWGDCGYQYGKVWRNGFEDKEGFVIDQISNLIKGLKNNPQSRRHIVTAIDPAHDQDLALYWCHAMFQFNCRPIKYHATHPSIIDADIKPSDVSTYVSQHNLPKYYLDCQLYQRSADVVLGVPFNIASYALLTEIIAKMCNMIPGEFIHTFGDVHIYDNHKEAVEEQLTRVPSKLPKLELPGDYINTNMWEGVLCDDFNYNLIMEALVDYNPQEKIKAELSTGMKK